MNNLIDIVNLTPLLFILTLTILTNFIGDTINCKIQDIVRTHFIFKHTIIIFLIYTTIAIMNKNNNPVVHFKKTLILWFLYVMFTKTSLNISITIIILMIILFIIEEYIKYYKDEKNKNDVLISKLNKINNYLKHIILLVIVLGHLYYIYKKHTKYNINFDIIKFYNNDICIKDI